MNATYRKHAVALAVAAVIAAPAAIAAPPVVNAEANLALNAEANLLLNAEANLLYNRTDTQVRDRAEWERTAHDSSTVERNYSETSQVDHDTTVNSDTNINYSHNANTDVRTEVNEHDVGVRLRKDLSLSSDIAFSGDPTISGDIAIDSAAIAVVDNRQSITGNQATNHLLDNDAAITDDVAANASGNLGFNVAAGDNNTQDNAASLSAADASFSFGMADAEVFVNQHGSGNNTVNMGVTNAAGLSGNAFSGAAGNIGVNVASGNNNEQKNALAASVATSAYAQSSISSNQTSSGNAVNNQGYFDEVTSTTQISLGGTVAGTTSSSGSGDYAGSGNSYQKTNFYVDNWTGNRHTGGNPDGHSDWDIDTQGAVANPNRPGVGGMAWDTDEAGSIAMEEMGTADLQASLTGTVTTTDFIAVYATNTAGLSGSAFSNASGNIGVNVASGTGNLQANSLALAVAQPSTGGGNGGGE
ncbi:adhesin [Stenotrophomonas ginsengisoli]|uniref:Adhesin n=1 Tax=Stenotrophomonas ginsengisoli TaxID=336566 RepID=A0A0R0D5G9_9GAMM|nr:hypothetical protein [Stenotrophomonas ginsengisoli]KRG76774.1 adhesin [Stenotrophomonas ginsengisoli]